MKPIHALILAAGLVASPALLAHDHGQVAPNGGQLREVNGFDYELVVAKDSRDVKENPVVVYVTAHDGGKVPTVGATGSATVLSGKLKMTVALKPDGDNRLKGSALYASVADLKVVVSITLTGKPTGQARFTPLTPASK